MNTVLEQKAQVKGFYEVSAALSEVESVLAGILQDISGPIGTMGRHILEAGGKRLRPLLVLYSGMLGGKLNTALIKAAAAAELIHMASLVHDDVIDKAAVRRGRPSVNRLWGSKSAVLCGDYLFAQAFGMLAENRLIDSMDEMVAAIREMCSAELRQAENRYNASITEKEYYQCIAGKTAVFISCCCRSGILAVGGRDSLASIMGEFGLNLGLAFQITDDILDIMGDSRLTGKPVYEDMTNGIITLPLIYLLQNEKYGLWAQKLILGRKITKTDAREIGKILKSDGYIKKAAAAAQSHCEKAVTCLRSFESSPYLNELRSMVLELNDRLS